MKFLAFILLISSLMAAGVATNVTNPLECVSPIRPFDPHIHKSIYKVGVHAIRGLETAMTEYNITFGE
jgi:hypothetical protein